MFREPELLEAVGEILTGRGAKTAIQSSGGREAPCVAQSAACAMLMAALKVRVLNLPNMAGAGVVVNASGAPLNVDIRRLYCCWRCCR